MVMAWAGQTCRGLAAGRAGHGGYWEVYSFAKLAGDAALFTRGVPAEGVFATETGGDRSLH
jgi:hypothetical protein